MAITVSELIAMPHLRSRIAAGLEGADRAVGWAHVCEMAQPWEWLGQDDLLMTIGFGLPDSAEGQERYIENLDRAGLAGAAIAEDVAGVPPVLPSLLSAADRLKFPVIRTSYDVAFVEFSRAISLRNQAAEHRRFTQTVRVYETVREGMAKALDGGQLLATLSDKFACPMYIVDRRGRTVLEGSDPLPGDVREAITAELGNRDTMPAVIPLEVGNRDYYVLRVPSRHLALLVLDLSCERPNLGVAQHIATVMSVEIERLTATRDSQRHRSAELFADLLEQRVDTSVGQLALASHGLGTTALMMLAVVDPSQDFAEVHHDLYQEGVAHLASRSGHRLFFLIEHSEAALDSVRTVLGPSAQIGASEPFHGARRLPDAAREARWALQVAQSQSMPWARYGDSGSAFVPRTLAEAEVVVTNVLGRLIEYDAEHQTDLLDSLRVFLEHDRSWQRAAGALQVHKQTLVYRLRRVEEITGRRLRDTSDIVTLFLALQAMDLLVSR